MKNAASSMLLDITAAGKRLVAVGERGHILYSDDHGASWEQVQVPTAVMLTRVFFVSPSMGWAVGHDGNVLFSENGGITWELQRDGVADQVRINEERAGRAKDLVDALRDELAVATGDKSDYLQEQLDEAEHALDVARDIMEEPVFAPPLMDIWFANEEQGWAVGAFGILLHTSNGGRSWDDWSHKVDNPEELHLNGVAGSPDGTLYLVSEWGYVFRSATAGETWKTVETGYDGSFFGVLVNPATDSVFAYGLLGTIYRSTDRGLSWDELDSKVSASFFGAAGASDGTLVFVGQNDTVVYSSDDGNSFRSRPQGSRRGLHGITAIGDGRFVVTGEGGSTVLTDRLGSRR